MAKSNKAGSSAKGRQHANHKGKYLKQWGRTSKNKQKAWAKHLVTHPSDSAAKGNIAAATRKLTSYKSGV